MDTQFSPIPGEAEEALPGPQTRSGQLARFFLRRYPVWPVIAFLAKKRVPEHKHSAWYMMGGIAMFFFFVQLVTGLLLMVYYRPSQPWASVNRIVMEVPFGAFIRSLHHWSANLMILTLLLHMFSSFFMKAYRPPRELTWLTGLALLGLSLFFGFSGYLLPWDNLSFFAVRIGLSEMDKVPVLGPWGANLLRGGAEVTVDTIGRFYVLHVVALPLLVLLLLGAHLTFIQLQGISEPDHFRALPDQQKKYRKFFSDYLVAELPVWLFCTGLLVALCAALPRELHPEADVFAAAPAGIKPEWYFLAPYQALKLFPGKLEYAGMALMGAAPLAALVLPFVDRRIPADARGRMIAKIGAAALVGLIAMTIWGLVS